MAENKVQLTRQLINSQPNVSAILDLAGIEQNWIRTYESISGKKDGESRFNAEKILFLQTISSTKALEKCDKFSVYSSFIELAISGLTLRDGIAYIVPFAGKASFMPGWRGRLEQINEIPTVVHCHEPQVVWDCDQFEYEKGEKVKITKHKPGNRTPDSKITHVYFVIEFSHGAVVYIMDAVDVLHIRDTYSQSYKQYVKDCKRCGKEIGSTWEETRTWNGQSYNVTIEPPMWVADETQAFKKTIVKRVYGTLPKLPKQKWLDEKVRPIEEKVDIDEIVKEKYDEFIDLPSGDENQASSHVTKPALTQNNSNKTTSQNKTSEVITPTQSPSLVDLSSNPNEGF